MTLLELIFAHFALASGIILLLSMAAMLWLGFSSTRWPTTKGKVLKASLSTTENGKRELFFPLIEYVYSVNGKDFSSNTVDTSLFKTSKKSKANEILRTVEVGCEISVYYHPWFNKLSVIVPGIKQAHIYLFFIIMALFILTQSVSCIKAT